MAQVGILPLADALNTVFKNRKCYVYELKVGGQNIILASPSSIPSLFLLFEYIPIICFAQIY